ncbi:uncharacterized protein LOC113471339 [Diaphorina citri]|uniref:Uncharacterized protein LOC113471339 n=1 Tax=Diaphorina citri TaxID=121845 RepID=A0A3Q0JCR1_DIACI|nr:uncharacterized protein LOC113471339 [Diaphorina citri]
MLKSHLDSPTEGLSSLKEKLTRSHQKRTALKRKYKALCHIHKSSLIELYNLAVQESNGLRNDISLLNNVIHKLNEELSRYENRNSPGVAREPPTQATDVKVTKLTSLKELHIFEPLMRSYEALLVDRTALIDKYRRDQTLLRNQNKSLEVENHELRKTLAEFESSVAVNNHKIESLIINKDLLAEQNEVLIHKVNLFNTTLNLLLSKYETLEIKNLQNDSPLFTPRAENTGKPYDSGKGHKRNLVKLNGSARDLGENQDEPLHGGVDQDIGREKSNTPSLKVCKKWLIGELKRSKNSNRNANNKYQKTINIWKEIKNKFSNYYKEKSLDSRNLIKYR